MEADVTQELTKPGITNVALEKELNEYVTRPEEHARLRGIFEQAAPLMQDIAQNLIVGFFVAAIAISLILTPARFRLIALPALTILPLQDFAQREHFALITTVPYCLLIASRLAGERVRAPWAIGLFAALGFALNPYFVAVPIALELLAWRQKRVRPETIALAAVAVTYLPQPANR